MTVAYAADVTAVVDHLKRKNTIHVAHSTGDGKVAHYVAAYEGSGRVSKTVRLGAVPLVILKSKKNPGGLPIEAFCGLRNALAANRSRFHRDVCKNPL